MKRRRYMVFAWGTLFYTVAVILWGAYVRATGSGAGCGSHWPLCDGVVIPRAETTEQLIEFTHRLTSALDGLLVLVLLVWAFRLYPKGHIVRKGATFSFIFIITEGLAGAGLVLFELVAYNTSLTRAIVAGIHLVNTFLLLGAITMTAWWASGGKPVRLRNQGNVLWLLGIGVLGMLLLGASGAITALGDTLFPSNTVAEGLRQDFSPTAHFLVRLRIWHPLIAIGLGIYLWQAAKYIANARPSLTTARLADGLKLLFLIQIGAGFLNVFLNVPIWMQIVHLLLADAVWINFVLLGAATLAQTEAATDSEPISLAPQAGD